MEKLLWVGLGGALGAICRYLLGLLPMRTAFPFVTLGINFTGAVLIGFVACAAICTGLSENLVLFLKTGFCGGFTTFSAFSLETFQLLENGKPGYGLVYAFASVFFCIFGVWIGGELSAFFLAR